MRMWLVNPKAMCKNHLLGEHLELHMVLGCLRKGKSITGYIENGLVDPSLLLNRHDELVKEMKCRGYNHLSPIAELPVNLPKGQIDREVNRLELINRCPKCRELRADLA
jgi:hypothetical protein